MRRNGEEQKEHGGQGRREEGKGRRCRFGRATTAHEQLGWNSVSPPGGQADSRRWSGLCVPGEQGQSHDFI